MSRVCKLQLVCDHSMLKTWPVAATANRRTRLTIHDLGFAPSFSRSGHLFHLAVYLDSFTSKVLMSKEKKPAGHPRKLIVSLGCLSSPVVQHFLALLSVST